MKAFKIFLVGLIAVLAAWPQQVDAQSKKMREMMAWQEQQAKQEKFDAIVGEAHLFFQ